MPLNPDERKALFAEHRVMQGQVARELRVTASLVCHVVAGRRYWGKETRRIMEHMAQKVNLPVDEVFPEYMLGWGEGPNNKPAA